MTRISAANEPVGNDAALYAGSALTAAAVTREGLVSQETVHRSRDGYFARLYADPYGLENEAYDWRGEDRFVAVLGPFYLAIAATLGVLGALGVLPALNTAAMAFFGISIVFEVAGKLFASWLVMRHRVRINYVRKLILRPVKKLSAFVIPLLIVSGDKVIIDIAFLFCLGQLKTIAFEYHRVRRRVALLRYAFVSWDRLEDRPYSLRYDMLEDVFRFAVYLPFMALVANPFIVLVPQLINEFGDGLAEPVGIRFGKHKYRTRALWHNGRIWAGQFVRSLEGSATVFIVSGVVLCGYQFLSAVPVFTPEQFLVAMAVMPLGLTLAEAVSPHTCDGPLMALSGCGLLLGIFSL